MSEFYIASLQVELHFFQLRPFLQIWSHVLRDHIKIFKTTYIVQNFMFDVYNTICICIIPSTKYWQGRLILIHVLNFNVHL